MAYLDNTTQKDYYEGRNYGSYQFVSLEDVINQFIAVYTGEDQLIPRVKRMDEAFHAQRALAELSFDTFKSVKSQQVDIPPSLSMILPHDYVNYTKVTWVDSSGIKRPLYPTRHTSNPFQIKQNSDGQYTFDPDEELIVNNLFNDTLTDPWFWSSHRTDMQGSLTEWEWPKGTGNMGVATGYSGIKKGSNITIVNNQLSFNHSSHGSFGVKHGKAMIAYQEIDVTGIELLNLTASANTVGAGTVSWDLMSNAEKFTAGQDLDASLFSSNYKSIIEQYNAGDPDGTITQTVATGGGGTGTTFTLDSLEPIVSATVNGATGSVAGVDGSITVDVDSVTDLEVGMRITAASAGDLASGSKILMIAGNTLTLNKENNFTDNAVLTCKGPQNDVIVGSTITAVSSGSLSGTPTVTAINTSTKIITLDGSQTFADGITLTFSAAYDEDLLKSSTNTALDSATPATTVRVGICTKVTEEMKTNTFIGDTTRIAYPRIITGYDADGDPIYARNAEDNDYLYDFTSPTQRGQAMSPNNSADIFDLETITGEPSYQEWSEGVSNGEKTIDDIDVTLYDKVYFVVASIAPFQTHAYTGELGVLTAVNTVDDISVKSSAVSALKSPTANIVESSTWKNYKSATPSENNNDDYEDETYWPNLGGRLGLSPAHAQTNGSFYIDDRVGKINFSSNISGKTVILDYISDGLGTEAEMKVHKLAEEAMYNWIAYSVLCGRRDIPAGVVNRFQRRKFAETRKAKLRLSNIKLEEITQALRGKSKHLKH